MGKRKDWSIFREKVEKHNGLSFFADGGRLSAPAEGWEERRGSEEIRPVQFCPIEGSQVANLYPKGEVDGKAAKRESRMLPACFGEGILRGFAGPSVGAG